MRASRSSNVSRSNTNNIDNSTEEEQERRRCRKKRKKRERKESRRSHRTRSISPPAVATGTNKRVPIDMRMMTITINTRRRGIEDIVLAMTVQMVNMVVVVTMTKK